MRTPVAPAALRLSIAPESFVWLFATISREQRLPFSAAILVQQFPPPYDLASIQRVARALDVEAEIEAVDVETLKTSGAGMFTLMRPAPIETSRSDRGNRDPAVRSDPPHDLVRVVAFDGDRVLVDRPDGERPSTQTPASFAARYAAYAIRLEAIAGAPHVDRETTGRRGTFGWGWFTRELLRYPRLWRDVLLASLGIQLLALLVPLLTQVVLDKVIVHRTENTLVVVAFGLVAITLFSAVLAWIRQYLVLHTGTRIDAVLGARVFDHLLQLPPRYFEARPTGVLVARIHCVETVREFITGAALVALLDLPFIVVFAGVMLYYSPTLTWIALGVLAMLIVLSIAVTPLLRDRINRQFLAGARHQAFVTEYLAGIETVKSLQLEPQLDRRYEELFGRYLAAGFAARQLANTFNACAQALEQLLLIAILCVGAWLVISGAELTIGGLIAFQMFASRLTGPVLRMAGLWQEFQQVDVAMRRLGDIMDAPAEPRALVPAHGADVHGRIDVQGLGFRYGEDRAWLFRGLSFALDPHGCVAVIGASGSGKSTLARVLQGFYLPGEGEIRIDGIDIKNLAANELRAHFGVVPQESRLFAGTILQNVLDANPQADVEAAIEACRLARVHDVIAALPDGYLTWIGENGVGLSGGQKQRIAIARALVKRPRVLILDEATASLDPDLVRAVVDTVNSLRNRVAVLFIAHRLPETLECDAVVAMGAAANKQGDAQCNPVEHRSV